MYVGWCARCVHTVTAYTQYITQPSLHAHVLPMYDTCTHSDTTFTACSLHCHTSVLSHIPGTVPSSWQQPPHTGTLLIMPTITTPDCHVLDRGFTGQHRGLTGQRMMLTGKHRGLTGQHCSGSTYCWATGGQRGQSQRPVQHRRTRCLTCKGICCRMEACIP